MRIVVWVMAGVFAQQLAASSGALIAMQPAPATKASLDFEYFKTQVQPVFLTKRAGYTRCVVCHSGGGEAGFLQALSPGATSWTEEQSRKNFEAVSRLVVAGQPMKSRLLTHPLEPTAGGDEFLMLSLHLATQPIGFVLAIAEPSFQNLDLPAALATAQTRQRHRAESRIRGRFAGPELV